MVTLSDFTCPTMDDKRAPLNKSNCDLHFPYILLTWKQKDPTRLFKKSFLYGSIWKKPSKTGQRIYGMTRC